ncbi:MAG: hypothetical protein WCS18_02785 [Sphaerochaetaceae bacterium]
MKHIARYLLLIMVVAGIIAPAFATGQQDGAMETYVGKIERIVTDAKTGSPALLVQDVNGGIPVLFRTAGATQFSRPIDEFLVGDMVVVGFNGIMTRSIPAQASAMNIDWLARIETN